MKQLLLFLLFIACIGVRAQVLILDGCNSNTSYNISGAYYLSGTTASGHNKYEANHSVNPGCMGYCNPQTISVAYDGNTNAYRWEIRMGQYMIEAYNTNTSSVDPPETGWVKASDFTTACWTAPSIIYPTTIESTNCSGCNWDDPNSWIGGVVPTASNHVVINGDVLLNVDASCINLTINTEKSLTDIVDKSITVKGGISNQGLLKAFRLTIQSYSIPQELDGTKFNIQNLTLNNKPGVTLTGDLEILKPGGSSANNVQLISGSIFLGSSDLTCHGVSRLYTSPVPRIVTNGTGSLKYQLPGGVVNKEFLVGRAADENTSEHYAPVTITGAANSGGSQPVTISVHAGSFNPSHTIPENVKNVLTEWTLTSDHVSLETAYTVKFGWGAYTGSMSTGFNLNSIYVKRWNGFDWVNKTEMKTYESYSGVGYGVTATGITEFSSWGVFDSEAVLPVKLVDFSAIQENGLVFLQWSTTEEVNSENFEIEHSIDGKRWDQVGTVDATGEGIGLMRYSFSHDKPVGGNNYYRLKMRDSDGSFTYSHIRSVQTAFGMKDYLYPNPVVERIYLRSNVKDVLRVSLLTTSGVLVEDKVEKISDGIPTRNLSPGIYILRVRYKDGEVRSHKVVIK